MAELVFAVVSRAPDVEAPMAVFCSQLGTHTALAVRPLLLESFPQLVEAFAEGRADVGWAPPLVAIELGERELAEPMAVVKRGVRAGYHCALFARRGSPLRSAADLAATTVAWVSRDSASGYFVPRWHLRSQGVDLQRAFAREIFCQTHDEVARAVLDGRAEVGATHVALDSVTGKLATAPWLNLGADPGAIRVLLLIGPIPGDVIVAGRRLGGDERRSLLAALLALHGSELVAAREVFDAQQFEPVSEGHLSLLRRLSRYS